jgi:hypothetical protein
MLRAALLTFRMHRFEVLVTAALAVLTTVSAAVVYTHVTAANPPDQCWIENWGGMFTGEAPTPDVQRTPGCQGLVEAFWPVASEASFVASPIGVLLPFVVGLLLGVPIVGRELELRTAALSWSLTGDRLRWLVARFLPVLGLALIGLIVAAFAVAEMARAAHPWNYLGPGRIPSLTELGSEGPTLVGRGVMALGIALLAGALIGRTLPAFAAAAIACFVLLFGGAPLVQGAIIDRVAVWQDGDEFGQPPALSTLRVGFRDGNGQFLTEEQGYQLIDDMCAAGGCDERGDPWTAAGLTYVALVAPTGSYPVFEAAETTASTAIGTVAMLLTFPVVSRRRPT